MCEHIPPCPTVDAEDREAARAVHRHPEQGWSLLCNGLVLFDDGGELLPGGRVVPPHATMRHPAGRAAGAKVPTAA